jgi:hypothetical protein
LTGSKEPHAEGEVVMRTFTVTIAASCMVAATAGAATTPEQRCNSERAKAAGVYSECIANAIGMAWTVSFTLAQLQVAARKCVTKYAATWPRLQMKAAGTGVICERDRFRTDVPGIVIDRLTALRWEIKTNLDGTENFADPHDADNTYTWTSPPGETPDGEDGTGAGMTFAAADGTAFTSFLASLNGAPCFTGQCDWRLPTPAELLTIVTPAYPTCPSSPCIDAIFGPTVASQHWSAATIDTLNDFAWNVNFTDGSLDYFWKLQAYAVRAVRAGL